VCHPQRHRLQSGRLGRLGVGAEATGCSVADLTRHDARSFFSTAIAKSIKVTAKPYPLEHANEALVDLRNGELSGATVLVPQAQLVRYELEDR